MLRFDQMRTGYLKDAEPLSLMLPTDTGTPKFLVCGSKDDPVAVELGGEDVFSAFRCGQDTYWRGLLILDVHLEVDETSRFERSVGRGPVGSLELNGQSAHIVTRGHHGGAGRVVAFSSPSIERSEISVGFARWEICVGLGDQKQVLHSIDRQTNGR